MSKSKNAFRALSLLDDESAESIAGKQSKRAQRRVQKAAEHRSGRPRNLPSSYGSSQCDAGQIYVVSLLPPLLPPAGNKGMLLRPGPPWPQPASQLLQ